MTRAMEQYLRGDRGTPFCPGCGHGVLMGAVLRAVDMLDVRRENLLFVSGIGCAAWIPSPGFDVDTLHTLHGRAIPFAAGAKLANPSLKVVVVSGDGDLFAIGGNHFIHGARRNDDITVICANNMTYGMTGGQTAPTTPKGTMGAKERPFDLSALASAAGAVYAARYPVTRPVELINSIRKALSTTGFTFVEAISPCPTHFGAGNDMVDPQTLFAAIDAMCVSREQADALPLEERKRRIVVGELTP